MATTFLSSALFFLLRLIVILLTAPVRASSACAPDDNQKIKMSVFPDILRMRRSITALAKERYAQSGVRDMVQLITLCGMIGAVSVWYKRRESQHTIVASNDLGVCDSGRLPLSRPQHGPTIGSQIADGSIANCLCRFREDGPRSGQEIHHL